MRDQDNLQPDHEAGVQNDGDNLGEGGPHESTGGDRVQCGDDDPPPWTHRYPIDDRLFLKLWGHDPALAPRAHEFNLRLCEFGVILDKAFNYHRTTSVGRSVLKRALSAGLYVITQRVEPFWRGGDTLEGSIGRFREGPADHPPARPPSKSRPPPIGGGVTRRLTKPLSSAMASKPSRAVKLIDSISV